MPTYSFECYDDDGGCGHYFEITCSMSEIENKRPKCPNCQKKSSVFRNYDNNIYVFDSSPKTIGALADRNAARMSDEEINHIKTKNRIKKPKFTGSLPEGASLLTVDNKGNKIIPNKQGKDFRKKHE